MTASDTTTTQGELEKLVSDLRGLLANKDLDAVPEIKLLRQRLDDGMHKCVNPPFAPPRTQHARPRKLHWRLTVMPMTNPGVWQVPRWLWVRWSVSCWRAVDCR